MCIHSPLLVIYHSPIMIIIIDRQANPFPGRRLINSKGSARHPAYHGPEESWITRQDPATELGSIGTGTQDEPSQGSLFLTLLEHQVYFL